MLWCNIYFTDTRLPFFSRSSPYIFNTFADILTWIIIHAYAIPYILHYLDDFCLADNTEKLAVYMDVMKKHSHCSPFSSENGGRNHMYHLSANIN